MKCSFNEMQFQWNAVSINNVCIASKKSIWGIDGSKRAVTISCRRGPEINANEG